MTIYAETGYGTGVMSDIWTEPLVFSDSDDNGKQLFINTLTEGFDALDYERGYEYILKVKKIWMKEPPQDVSAVKYVYVQTLSKEKALATDSEKEIEMIVSAETVRFMPRFPPIHTLPDAENGENDQKAPVVYDALFVKEEGESQWKPLLAIEGFVYEKGNEYRLKAKKVFLADTYQTRYTLLDILSQNRE
ncbi:MAG: DUF4377 domain-containing protein [Breznakibacter sp.]